MEKLKHNLEKIGTVWSGSGSRKYSFLIDEGKEVRTNQYVLTPHPMENVMLLAKTTEVVKTNPFLEKPGSEAILLRTEFIPDLQEQEVPLATASNYGYLLKDGWQYPDVAPGTDQPVYQATEGIMKKYRTAEEGVIDVGRFRDFDLANELNVDALNEHMFVCGMTGSGKTTFVLNFLKSILDNFHRPHVVVFDTKGDYKIMEKFGVSTIPYYKFKPAFSPDPSYYVSALHVDPKRKVGEILHEAAERMIMEGNSSKNRLRELVEEIAPKRTSERYAKQYIDEIGYSLEHYGGKLEPGYEPKHIGSTLERNPIVTVDFSVDTKVEEWQRVGRTLIQDLYELTTSKTLEGVLLAIEETQWWAPERGYGVGSPSQSRRTLTQTMSQARTYNLGFIIISQRPQSVTKGAISQCGTYACFRVRNPNDHKQIRESAEYDISGSELAGLDDHEGLLFGAACPYKFPVSFYTNPEIFPSKGGRKISQSWRKESLEEKSRIEEFF